MNFGRIKRQIIEGDFDGGTLSSDGGLLLLKQVDERIGLSQAIADILPDYRDQSKITHQHKDLIAQRLYALCCGYEDINDHNDLRGDFLLQTAVGNPDKDLGSAPTFSRLESRLDINDVKALNNVLFDNFINRQQQPPKEIILDFDASDIPLYGNQESKEYHGYYGSYCYLPLYVYCGDDMVACHLRNSRIDGAKHAGAILKLLIMEIRKHWPDTHIIFRGDGGFNRTQIINWLERNQERLNVSYIVGLAKNGVLKKAVAYCEEVLKFSYAINGEKQRYIGEFTYQAKSWKQARRTIARLEWGEQGNNPRFITTNLPKDIGATSCYDDIYCARGEAENRIKETQLDLFGTRTSASLFKSNYLRVMLSAIAYTLMKALRRIALQGTKLATATATTIRNKLLKIAVIITKNTRRIRVSFASNHPYRAVFAQAAEKLIPD